MESAWAKGTLDKVAVFNFLVYWYQILVRIVDIFLIFHFKCHQAFLGLLRSTHIWMFRLKNFFTSLRYHWSRQMGKMKGGNNINISSNISWNTQFCIENHVSSAEAIFWRKIIIPIERIKPIPRPVLIWIKKSKFQQNKQYTPPLISTFMVLCFRFTRR